MPNANSGSMLPGADRCNLEKCSARWAVGRWKGDEAFREHFRNVTSRSGSGGSYCQREGQREHLEMAQESSNGASGKVGPLVARQGRSRHQRVISEDWPNAGSIGKIVQSRRRKLGLWKSLSSLTLRGTVGNAS